MAQIFTMVKQAIIKNTSDSIKKLSGNIILTGGGAQMQGVVELAQEIFKTSSVRLGKPESLGGLEEEYRKPEFATAIGLVVANKGLAEARNSKRRPKKASAAGGEKKENIFSRIRKFFF